MALTSFADCIENLADMQYAGRTFYIAAKESDAIYEIKLSTSGTKENLDFYCTLLSKNDGEVSKTFEMTDKMGKTSEYNCIWCFFTSWEDTFDLWKVEHSFNACAIFDNFDDAVEWKNSSEKRKPRKTNAEKLEELDKKEEQLKRQRERIKSMMKKAEKDARDKRLKQIGAVVERYCGQITDIEKFGALFALHADTINDIKRGM